MLSIAENLIKILAEDSLSSFICIFERNLQITLIF